MSKVDLSAYAEREQAYVKHYLIEEYLPEWCYKVGTKWNSLVYIDGFAGPWKVTKDDLSDSSFAVAVKVLKGAILGLRGKLPRPIDAQSILVGKDAKAAEKLERFAENHREQGFDVKVVQGEFKDTIPAIEKLVGRTPNPFKFVFLDPAGWADIPMSELKSFLGSRSCEVLITLMTRHITRFLDEGDRANSFRNLFGRDGVLESLQRHSGEERTEQAVREYCRSLKLLCHFKYVSSAVILEPNKEAIRYFLVFATNHYRGIEVFKGAEIKAAGIQDMVRSQVRRQRTGLAEFDFDGDSYKTRKVRDLRERYLARAKDAVIREILASTDLTGVPYRQLFCEAMAFPIVTPDDLAGWIASLDSVVSLELSGDRRKRPSPSEDYDDRVIIKDRKALASLLQ